MTLFRPEHWPSLPHRNDDFAAIEDLSEEVFDGDRQLTDFLTFHTVIGQAFMFDNLLCTETIVMANTDSGRTQCIRDKVTREVIKYQKGLGQIEGMLPMIPDADLIACNGVVHVVNNVMIPKL